MSNSDDAAAIDAYFRSKKDLPGAASQYASWREFYDGMWWWSDDDIINAKKRRDILNQALGYQTLEAQGFISADKQPPLEMTTSGGVTSVKIFAGGGALPTIRKGSRGGAVTKWQQILIGSRVPGYNTITADGNFGAQTEILTRNWQAAKGIGPDGVVGPVTWNMAGIHTVSDLSPEYKQAVEDLSHPSFAAPSAISSGYPTIKLGSSGPDVVRWQNIVGISPADGAFGPITDAATKKWQIAHKIAPDGVVGPVTWQAAEAAGAAPKVPAGYKPPPVPGATVSVPTKTMQASTGVFDWIGKLPTWGKVVGVLAVGGAAIASSKKAGR